ncbi:conserved phage C-terminal domain-containing protein [Streptococcus pluranimalium]
MAQRRMFSKKITDTDKFMAMPDSAKILYFYLNMNADDDGFIGNPKTIQRMIGSNDDDMTLLIAKQYVIPFDSGVIVIKDWKIHNYIQSDRYQKTIYKDEIEQLNVKRGETYTFKNECIQNVSKMYPQDRLDKDRLDKDRLDIYSPVSDETKDDIPYKEIIDYLNDKAKTNYRASGKDTKSHIKARWNEGFNLDDFKTVIDKQVARWTNTEYQQYLRPKTLFGTKFESYLNSPEPKKSYVNEYPEDMPF